MKNKSLTMIQLNISRDEIRESYDRYDSVRCNRGAANAVLMALRKRIKPKCTPRIAFASNHNACELQIGEERLPLPQKLYWWLRQSENGIEVKPSEFSFAIFSEILIKKRNGYRLLATPTSQSAKS